MKPFGKPNKLSLSQQTQRDEKDGNTIVLDQSNAAPNDEIQKAVVENFLNPDNIITNSRIKPEQISNLSKLALANTIFNAPICGQLFDYILKLQVSVNGLGRREMVQMVQMRNGDLTPETMLTSGKIFR